MKPRLVAMAGRRLVKDQFPGIPEDDILLQARVTIEAVAEGRGEPRAAARPPRPNGTSGPTRRLVQEAVAL